MNKILQPEGWAKPAGYSNGVSARGRTIFVAGQIGWNKDGVFESDDFVEQFRQALKNIVDVLACDGAGPEHLTALNWYFLDRREYLANLRGVGAAYREIIGRHYPAMTAVQVAGLIEERAKIEIQATAVVPE